MLSSTTTTSTCNLKHCNALATHAVTWAHSSPTDPTPFTANYCEHHAHEKHRTGGGEPVPLDVELPACPDWCQGGHGAAHDDGGGGWSVTHVHRTSAADARFVVQVEQHHPLNREPMPVGVYVRDAEGDDVSAVEARAMAAALVEAAAIAEAVTR